MARVGMDAKLMPFGKHKGERIDNLAHEDPGYLNWALEEVDMDRWPGLYQQVREALIRAGTLEE